MNAPMRTSVVIATRNRAGHLARVLATLATQSGAPSFETIVVDNGSSDATHAVAADAQARGALSVRYVFEAEPNRAKARNRGVALAGGELVLFCDDDVALPEGYLAAHARAHDLPNCVVSGPILNVASDAQRPLPRARNYSGAFLCTCNASLPRALFDRVGGFDEAFSLYGWEDTELGVRLRDAGGTRRFAWDAYLWHLKPPGGDALDVELRKAVERAQMARKFVDKHRSLRARLATGAYPPNVLRGRLIPEGLLRRYAAAADDRRLPAWLRALARAALLDATYTRELSRAFVT